MAREERRAHRKRHAVETKASVRILKKRNTGQRVLWC